jgi:Uma2 family endonuclease
MIVSPQTNYLSPEEYLEYEQTSPTKHEYVDGEIYAMVGASDAHNTLTFNLTGLLYAHLRGTGCRGYTADMKVKIATQERFYYPDLLVTCDERDRTDDVKNHPKLIIEVLSESTEDIDRGRKWKDYRSLEPLEEYVLIAPDQMLVEVARRNTEANRWEIYTFDTEQTVEFTSLGFQCAIATIYENVQ